MGQMWSQRKKLLNVVSTLRSKEIRPLVNSFELLDQHLPESTLDSSVYGPVNPTFQSKTDSVGFPEGAPNSKISQYNLVY